MNVWNWLNASSAALQAISATISAVLTAITILVLVVTWRAVKRQAVASELQADAARSLIRVAEEQTKAAIEAAESSKLQADLLARQYELSTAPLIVVEPDDRQYPDNCRIVNRGQGVAFQALYWKGGIEEKNSGSVTIFPVQPSTLAAGEFAYLHVPPGWDSWTVQYKGSDRQERWTIMYRDPAKGQEHVIRHDLQEIYLA